MWRPAPSRAGGVASDHPLPAAFSCHFLGVARFEPIMIDVETRRTGRSASSQRIEVSQNDHPILDAMLWSTTEGEGLEHDETIAPVLPGPDELPNMEELVPEGTARPYRFWENLEAKPIDFSSTWPPEGPQSAVWQEWLRFIPTPSLTDPWVDAARLVILVDLPSWPSAHRPHAWQEPPFIAPTLDLNVAFHQPATDEEWLLCDGAAPLSTRGLFGWTSRVWSSRGDLHTSGGGQCLYRPVRKPIMQS